VENITVLVQTFTNVFSISHLWDQFGVHERGHLDSFQSGIGNRTDQFKFFVGRQKRRFALQTVT